MTSCTQYHIKMRILFSYCYLAPLKKYVGYPFLLDFLTSFLQGLTMNELAKD